MRGLLRAKGLRSTLRHLRDSERAQGLVEYALIIVVVSLGTIAALTFLRDNIRGLFSAAGSSIALGEGGTGGTRHRRHEEVLRWYRSHGGQPTISYDAVQRGHVAYGSCGDGRRRPGHNTPGSHGNAGDARCDVSYQWKARQRRP